MGRLFGAVKDGEATAQRRASFPFWAVLYGLKQALHNRFAFWDRHSLHQNASQTKSFMKVRYRSKN
jgi:hypothetical protein